MQELEAGTRVWVINPTMVYEGVVREDISDDWRPAQNERTVRVEQVATGTVNSVNPENIFPTAYVATATFLRRREVRAIAPHHQTLKP